MSKCAICSQMIPKAAANSLLRRGFEILLLPPHPSLPEPVACHADMITSLVDGALLFDKIYSETYPGTVREIKEKSRCRAVTTEGSVGGRYPSDCFFNVAAGKSAALGHVQSSRTLRRYIEESGRVFIPVKQGYAACSSIVAEDALITADKGIADAAKDFFDVLQIAPGGVILEPYDSGFIGGASGFDGENVYFVGDLSTHPDGERIRRFLEDRSLNCVSLMSGELLDIGGIKFI